MNLPILEIIPALLASSLGGYAIAKLLQPLPIDQVDQWLDKKPWARTALTELYRITDPHLKQVALETSNEGAYNFVISVAKALIRDRAAQEGFDVETAQAMLVEAWHRKFNPLMQNHKETIVSAATTRAFLQKNPDGTAVEL